MSLSSILDSIARAASKRSGGPEELVSGYDATTYRYPLDVGNYDKGHYIVFHVNAQDKTQFLNEKSWGDEPQAIVDMNKMISLRGTQNPINGISDKISEAMGTTLGQAIKNTWNRNASDAIKDFSSGLTQDLRNLDSRFVRKIYRTTETVALYMPDNLTFGYNQHYNETNLSDSSATGLAAFGNTLMDMVKQGKSLKNIGSNMSPFLFNYLSGSQLLGNLGKPLFTAVSGVVQNPMIEVLYSSPQLREFNFTFMFYPRSEDEAKEVQKIIDTFRFHQAPEVKQNSSGYFLVPPSEFDIQFMYFGQENPNIDKISTCVLTGIQVDYTKAGGWVAYEVEGDNIPTIGGTGTPVGIAMNLSFKETRIVTKESLRPGEARASNLFNEAFEPARQAAEDRYNEAGPTETDVADYMNRHPDTPQSRIYAGGERENQA